VRYGDRGFRSENKFGQLLDWVASAEEVTITRHGKTRRLPLLVPAKQEFTRDEARSPVRRIRERAEQLKFGPFDWAEWKAFRDERRP
jgi:antitoxin (DNA-binding transcriptional repressor) of toxin-antitoxin stability system